MRRRSILDVDTWTRLFRAIVAPFAFMLLIVYDPAFAGLIVLGVALALAGQSGRARERR